MGLITIVSKHLVELKSHFPLIIQTGYMSLGTGIAVALLKHTGTHAVDSDMFM